MTDTTLIVLTIATAANTAAIIALVVTARTLTGWLSRLSTPPEGRVVITWPQTPADDDPDELMRDGW